MMKITIRQPWVNKTEGKRRTESQERKEMEPKQRDQEKDKKEEEEDQSGEDNDKVAVWLIRLQERKKREMNYRNENK